jgi:HlyD family secretion protein/macrolide-specific efflux system membrane fusion protein
MATTTRRRRRWPWIVGTLVVLVGLVLMMKRSGAGRKEIDSSLLVTVKRGDLQIEVIETGKVQPRERVEIKSKVAGQVQAVFVVEGAHVKKGQPLLKLDPTDFRRDVARAEADVARAEADIAQAKNSLEFAQLNLERRKRGLEGRGVAQIDVDAAENEVKAKTVALKTADASLAGLKVALGAAQDRLRYTQIDSPLDGTVIEKGIQPGEVVTPGVQATFEGKALLTVADLSTLLVKADLNQIDVAKVRLGQKVTLTLDALPGKTYDALVTKVAPASTTPKGKDVDVFPVEATLVKADGDIKPGMTADVRIHIETRAAVLSLPIEAVVKETGKSFVTRVGKRPDGTQRTDKTEVKVGARNDREIEISDGIKEGEQILIKPASAGENEYKM